MLDGLEAITWGELSHAYGGAEDTPGLLRQVASADGELAAQAASDLHGSIFHQGSVYPATVSAVPFLAKLAVGAPHQRAELVWFLGMLADDRHAYGRDFPQVRAAVSAHLDSLVLLLDDTEPLVREAAAYAAAKAGVNAEPIWRRWALEDDPAARATLALALGEVTSLGAETVLREAALHGEPRVRVAAAVALLRAGVDWPTGTITSLVAAIEDDAAIAWAWGRDGDWTDELVTAPAAPVAVAVVEELLRSGDPRVRRVGLCGLSARCDAQRSAPPVFVPLVAPLLDDPDSEVRHGVADVLRRAGAAAERFADLLAELAGRFPDTAGQRGFTTEYRAAETLQWLGDPRWVEPVCAAAARGHTVRFMPRTVRYTPQVLVAVREQLRTLPESAGLLAPMLGHWGTDAAALLPELLAAIGPEVAETLLLLGLDDHAAVPYWRVRASERGDLHAALAVRRLTGDTDVVLDALRAVLTGDAPVSRMPMPAIGDLGELLTPLLETAATHLTGVAERVYAGRDRQILAARVVAAVTGPKGVLPTVEAVLVAGDTPARHAADFIADLAQESPESVTHLAPLLRARLDDRWSRLSAARALARLGTPTAELTEPLVRGIKDYGGRIGPATILELRASETIPALRDLLGSDKRSSFGGSADDLVWTDELLQDLVKDTIRLLSKA
ncbi:hypothetical protein Ais01nite_08000 [Asanoa ishikariensis]|uniref:HEAT repeat n=1 Tax=Asanoa ishikariensis TaxID=137265 RepID=A0A1H3TC50_9ACTN|nr:hypothetical protein [Asanoa ishikariensis]GIF62765.1 hypothetical protein Ais01nite_08000 [Asanoa ishikariensis]SDZ47285.1 hypothetical protein SAMN05421684_5434 [Asanoa ishikariensis]